MRILITGSRTWTDISTIRQALKDAVSDYPEEIVVVHGRAQGADQIAARCAMMFGWLTEGHSPDWETHGRKAGFVRNAEMVKLGADICLAFIHNNSNGATMTADLAEKSGIPTIRYIQGEN